jgi:hypothetical protein
MLVYDVLLSAVTDITDSFAWVVVKSAECIKERSNTGFGFSTFPLKMVTRGELRSETSFSEEMGTRGESASNWFGLSFLWDTAKMTTALTVT